MLMRGINCDDIGEQFLTISLTIVGIMLLDIAPPCLDGKHITGSIKRAVNCLTQHRDALYVEAIINLLRSNELTIVGIILLFHTMCTGWPAADQGVLYADEGYKL